MYPANDEYVRLLRALCYYGVDTSPRDMKTVEIIGHSSVIDMRNCIVTLSNRKLNYKFLYAEAAWILSVANDVETISKYCKKIARFSDKCRTFYGAYGPRFIDQKDYVISLLKRDPSTRQAVINIWHECPPITKDVPCTLSWQFLIRGKVLNMVVTMRSSDAWLGWPYDVFNQCMTAAYIALETDKNLWLGKLILNCGSQHLYKHDFDKAQQLLNKSESQDIVPFKVSNYTSGQHLIDTLWEKANGKLPIFDS